MKKIISFIVAVIITATAYADCASEGLFLMPASGEIKKKPVFILEGFASADKIVLGLNTKYSIYLQSGDQKVRLNVTEICRSDYYLIQAILKPEKDLEEGKTYRMVIDSCKIFDVYIRFDRQSHPTGTATYTVNGIDRHKPRFYKSPEIIEKSFTWFGCGPESYVIFDKPFIDEENIFVKVRLKNLKNGNVATYYIRAEKDKIKVGYGMCAGAFVFNDGKEFEAQFQLMDGSGNYSSTSKWIKFTKPQEKDLLDRPID